MAAKMSYTVQPMDREAVEQFICEQYPEDAFDPENDVYKDRINIGIGMLDDHPLVQLVAQHRHKVIAEKLKELRD